MDFPADDLSVTIMAHPKRYQYVMRYMMPRLGKDVKIQWDINSRGVWPNARAAWLSATGKHHMVLQDDLYLCRNLVASVKAAVQAVPDKIISLYSVNSENHAAQEAGHSWIVIKAGCWGQALVLPYDLIREFVAWTVIHVDPILRTYDNRMAMWAVKTNRPVWCTVPSLVDHEGAATSTLGNSNAKRRATLFIGENISGTSIDWTPPTNPIKTAAGIDPKHWTYYHDTKESPKG